MESTKERVIEERFDNFCKTVLKRKAAMYYTVKSKYGEKEVSLDRLSFDLIAPETPLISPMKLSFMNGSVNEIFLIQDEDLYEALESLPMREKQIILLHEFCNYTDQQIGEQMGIRRSSVHYIRKKTLSDLKKILEKKGEK